MISRAACRRAARSAERPSTGHGMRMPSMSAIVGSTSIVWSGLSLIRPRFWPGALRKNGTGAMSCTFSAPHQAAVVAEPEADPVVRHHATTARS